MNKHPWELTEKEMLVLNGMRPVNYATDLDRILANQAKFGVDSIILYDIGSEIDGYSRQELLVNSDKISPDLKSLMTKLRKEVEK